MKIGFGTLFRVTKETALCEGRTDVVVDPEEGDVSYFSAAKVTNDGSGQQFSFLTGVGTAREKTLTK